MQAFMPGASPPEVSTPILFINHYLFNRAQNLLKICKRIAIYPDKSLTKRFTDCKKAEKIEGVGEKMYLEGEK
jgi:hypothetical protein